MSSCSGAFVVRMVILFDIHEKLLNAMKNKILLGFLSLGLLIGVSACDNGNADFSVVDSDPTVELGAMSGLVEGEDYTIAITFGDGAEGSTTSSLASGTWNITAGGNQVANGTLTPAGDNWTGSITASGLVAGDHTLSVTATDSNGNTGTATIDFTVAAALPDITGTWVMEPVAVGPSAGSAEWWFVPEGEVTGVRACFFDDVYTFDANGTFSYDQGGSTFLEGWQGTSPDACGTPVAPFDGSGSYTYSFTGATLSLIGTGAHVGLAKVNNEGEISQGAAVASQITYDVAEFTDAGGVRKMKLSIEAADGVFWTFLLIAQ